MNLKTSDRLRMRDYVRGLIEGAGLPTGNPHDGLVDDWFSWGQNYDLHVCLDDDGEYQCAVYRYDSKTSQTDTTEWHSINLGEEFYNHVGQGK